MTKTEDKQTNYSHFSIVHVSTYPETVPLVTKFSATKEIQKNSI